MSSINNNARKHKISISAEAITRNFSEAAEDLNVAGVVRCDAIEPLSEGFWGIRSPANIIHMVRELDAW
ncbi:hypothetical protein NDN11_11945 [Acinetobacter sp. C26M]|uniref:hypothetical protein n=1 Tax=unclassified Acinetobacter TaxID=196816 RepID=UPI0020372C14|nr:MULTISPECIES: hypothetical protein [unclassified Acinetobacter]USA48375.1 hypothetical protein NDN11_11945 [Acinetobacter sp. C26M]USA51863.1 hypothetical protein NDN12_11945 [Acinetobacter sp. C26G]